MMFLQILQYIGCALTALVGAYALLAPKNTTSFTGLVPQGGRGLTEIRVVFGMFFLALGIFPMISGNAVAFQMLGVTYILVGITRLGSILVDKSGNPSNWFSVIFELVFGVILCL
jgi:hypothetical protein